MSGERTALLFCPPSPPVELRRDQPNTIGRSTDCALVVASDAVSRRHSEVVWSGDSFVIRDLGSTNGTFVNGRPAADGQSLATGDRIEIGSSLITYCEVAHGVEGLGSGTGDQATVIFAQPARREVVQGDLVEIPMFAVLQMLEMGRKTGLLEVESPSGLGRIWLESGSPKHAETEKQSGLAAAFELVAVSQGRFRFEAEATAETSTIELSMTEVLLEGSRIADESAAH